MPIGRKQFFSYFYAMLFVAFVVVALKFFMPLYAKRGELEEKKSERARENAALENEIKDLTEKIAKFRSDPEFVEKVARERNQVRPNEVVFVFPREKAQ